MVCWNFWGVQAYRLPRLAVKNSAAADIFGRLGGAPSVFRLAAAPDDFGWERRRESAAESTVQLKNEYKYNMQNTTNSQSCIYRVFQN